MKIIKNNFILFYILWIYSNTCHGYQFCFELDNPDPYYQILTQKVAEQKYDDLFMSHSVPKTSSEAFDSIEAESRAHKIFDTKLSCCLDKEKEQLILNGLYYLSYAEKYYVPSSLSYIERIVLGYYQEGPKYLIKKIQEKFKEISSNIIFKNLCDSYGKIHSSYRLSSKDIQKQSKNSVSKKPSIPLVSFSYLNLPPKIKKTDSHQTGHPCEEQIDQITHDVSPISGLRHRSPEKMLLLKNFE